jgi:16S rRNA (cytidine1402-2'-O)-methyltransferase
MRKKQEQSVLYIVSTPIGNEDDISLRALKVLKKVDTVICEEEKIGALLAKRHNFSANLEQLNEHNEDEYAPQLIERLQNGESFALISDAGTPIFADPGRYFLNLALDANINIVVVPGPSSIMTALVRSGFKSDVFTCAGFLSRTTEDRLMEMQALALEPRTTVLLETPYRLKQILEAAAKVMPDRKAYIGCNLTMSFEHHHYGTFSELHQAFTDTPFKGEFVIVFEGHPGRTLLSVLSNFEKKKERIAISDSKKLKVSEETHDELFEADEDSLPIKQDIDIHEDELDSYSNSDEESVDFKKHEGDSGGYRKREGDSGGFRKRDGDSGGYKKRDGDSGGFRKRDGDSGGFRKRDGDSGGFRKRDGDSGGFRKRDGDSGGYRKRDGDSGGYKKRDGDSGGFRKRDGDSGGYRKRDGDSGGYKKRDGDSGGYKKRDGDSGGFRKRDGDSGGYKKRDGDSGGYRKRDGDSSGYRKRDGDSGGYKKRDGDSGGYKKRDGDSGGFRKRDGDSGGFRKRDGDSYSERSGGRDRKFGGKPSFDSKDKKKYKGTSDSSSGMKPPRRKY